MMRARIGLAMLVVAIFVSLTVDVSAQPGNRDGRGDRFRQGGFGPGGGPQRDALSLLQMPEVQKELKVTDEEKAYLVILNDEFRDQDREFFQSVENADRDERLAKMREHFTKRQEEVQAKVGEILGDDRAQRLREIRLQVAGPLALFSPDVASELKITDEQQEKFREEMMSMRGSMMEFFRGGDNDSKSREERIEEFRNAQTEKFLAILTPDQKEKWEKMKGEPISFKLPPPNFGRGERGDRRDRGGRGDGPGRRGPREGRSPGAT